VPLADFGKDNGPDHQEDVGSSWSHAAGWGLWAKPSVAIDGNNFKAVNKHPATGHDFANRKTLSPRSRCVKCRTE
jgi:hypothetical protein